MRSNRMRLLIASLAVAVVVSVIGGVIWSRTVADDDPGVDAELTDPQDRAIPADPDGLEPNGDVAGDRIPIVTISDRDGQDVSTESFVGDRPLVINLWFSACGPCAKELPEFAEVDDETGDAVRFVGINPLDSVPVMERFAEERGVTYDLFRDDLAEFTNEIEATNYPITLFVTSDGTIVDQTGPIDADELRRRIDDLEAAEALG